MAKKENSKNKRSFFKDFKAELKKVSWLSPKQLINNTVAVITIVFITAAIVFVLDLAFETLNTQGVDRIKETISENKEVENESVSDEEEQVSEEKNADESEESVEAQENTEATEQESVEE